MSSWPVTDEALKDLGFEPVDFDKTGTIDYFIKDKVIIDKDTNGIYSALDKPTKKVITLKLKDEVYVLLTRNKDFVGEAENRLTCEKWYVSVNANSESDAKDRIKKYCSEHIADFNAMEIEDLNLTIYRPKKKTTAANYYISDK